nr:hypothetical protein [Actinomycetota bacterium]
MSTGPTGTGPTSDVASVDVDAVAAAVVACPSVAHLVQGGPGEVVATFLPGRRVGGVRVTDEAIEVHIATRWDVPIPMAAAEVRLALGGLAAARSITVAVDDVDDPQAALPATTPDGPPLDLGNPGSPVPTSST